MAAVTAFIDMLPFLGSGAVLLPYALLTIVSGRLGMGVGILIIWGTVSLVRQIIEPKIMGKNLGVHPLVNIAAVYAGYMFFGVTGVIFLPITVVIIKNLFSERAK
jgi:predicted PurR-regulated permease PerM